MAKWTVIALIAGIGLFFYFYDHQSDAYKAYVHFDRMRLAGNCAELYKCVQGPAQTWTDQFCQAGSSGDALAGLAALGDGGPDGAYKLALTAGGLTGLQEAASISMVHKKESEDEADDGTVTVVARVFPVNRNNDGGSTRLMPSTHRQRVQLKKAGEAWKVVGFADEVAKD